LANKKAKDTFKYGKNKNLGELDGRLGARLIAKGYRSLFRGRDSNSGLTSGFSAMTMPLHMMR
jgi:hypothetical protein